MFKAVINKDIFYILEDGGFLYEDGSILYARQVSRMIFVVLLCLSLFL